MKNKRGMFFLACISITLLLFVSSSSAYEFEFDGNPMSIMGYFNRSANKLGDRDLYLDKKDYDSEAILHLDFEFILDPHIEFRHNESSISDPADWGNIGGDGWGRGINMPMGLNSVRSLPTIALIGNANIVHDGPNIMGYRDFGYGTRITTHIFDHIIQLYGYYGWERMPLATEDVSLQTMSIPAWQKPEGAVYQNLHPGYRARFPRIKYVGLSWEYNWTELQNLFPGDEAPLTRVESTYMYDQYKLDGNGQSFKGDEIWASLALETKWRIPNLHPEDKYYSVDLQANFMTFDDYPGTKITFDYIDKPYESYWSYSIRLATSYYANKIQPQLIYIYDYTNRFQHLMPSVTYAPTALWQLELGGNFFDSSEPIWPFLDDEDQIYFTISYKWN